MVETILANVGTVITFRSGNPADEEFLLHSSSPTFARAKSPAYHHSISICALLGLKPEEPFSGQTIVLANEGNEQVAQTVVAASRTTNNTRNMSRNPNQKPKVIQRQKARN